MKPWIYTLIIAFSSLACNQIEQISENKPLPASSEKKSFNPDSMIRGERIDGPANIRDTVNGDLLFTLDDNVLVTATPPSDNWLQVGLWIDITSQEMDSFLIPRGRIIKVNGQPVGTAIRDIHLHGAFKDGTNNIGEITGYTAVNNIKPNSVIENAFAILVRGKKHPITITSLDPLLTNFEFQSQDDLLEGCKGYLYHENWIEDPSPLLRIWLITKDDKLIGAFHSRTMDLSPFITTKVKRGFLLTMFDSNPSLKKELEDAFNSFIVQVD